MPMTCEGCVKDISASLYKLDGISKVEANLADQLVRIEGTGTILLNTPVLIWTSLNSGHLLSLSHDSVSGLQP